MKSSRPLCLLASLVVLALSAHAQTSPPAPAPASTPAPAPAAPDPQAEGLVQAAEKGDLAKVKVLLGIGVPIDSVDKDKESPLFVASQKHPDIALYLMSQGANVNLRASDGSTALLNACFGNDTQAALKLLDAGADPNLGSRFNRFPLMYAAMKGNDLLVSALLAHHANIDLTCNEGPAIYWSVTSDKVSTTKLLLDAGPNLTLGCTGNVVKERNYFPLLGIAAQTGDKQIIDLLLAHGATVETTSFDGNNALMAAAWSDNPHALASFLDLGASIDAENNAGQTALNIATFGTDLKMIQLLVEHHANPDLRDQGGRTALMRACWAGHDDIVRYLVKSGADVNVADLHGNTALIYAGSTGQTELVDFLAKNGATDTSVHVLPPASAPAKPLQPTQAWALAVGAIYAQRDGCDQGVLGNGRSIDTARDTLFDWKLTNTNLLLRGINDLENSGHHSSYIEHGHDMALMSDASFATYLAQNLADADRLTAERKSYQKWTDRSGVAWDLCRAAMLVNCGYASRMLTEKQAWDLLLPLSQEVQHQFGSWREMSDNFLDGREIWNGKRDPHFEACAKLLLDPAQTLSPWNQNPWQTTLATAP